MMHQTIVTEHWTDNTSQMLHKRVTNQGGCTTASRLKQHHNCRIIANDISEITQIWHMCHHDNAAPLSIGAGSLLGILQPRKQLH
jgi:hypothetical protein